MISELGLITHYLVRNSAGPFFSAPFIHAFEDSKPRSFACRTNLGSILLPESTTFAIPNARGYAGELRVRALLSESGVDRVELVRCLL